MISSSLLSSLSPILNNTEMHNHSTWIEINKSAIYHNINYFKNKIGKSKKLAVVVKGNGYGHDLKVMGTLCQNNHDVDYLCVAQLSEAIILVTHGITKPILVLGYSNIDPIFALNKNIEFMIDDKRYAETLNKIGSFHNFIYNVHIKIDTGLSRMGLLPDNVLIFIKYLQSLPFIKIKGIYSHFSAADTNLVFTQFQLKTFNNLLNKLSLQKIHIPYIHFSNTAALENITYPSAYNFFRVGLGIYGLVKENNQLKPALQWKTRISSIKYVEKNSLVGYAGTYKTQHKTRIALLPIGYSDGYQFRFSNKTNVLINGQLAPIIGRIAMNITIIDVTNITADINDEVILLGNHTGITAYDLAFAADIVNVREIITNINPLVLRIITE